MKDNLLLRVPKKSGHTTPQGGIGEGAGCEQQPFAWFLRREGVGQYACLGLASLSHFSGPSSVGAVPRCLGPGPEAFREGR